MSFQSDRDADDRRKAAFKRRQRNFLRRSAAAADGVHLPTCEDLLMGMICLSHDVGADLKIFAERLLPRLRRRPEAEIVHLVATLEQATVGASMEEVRRLAAAMEAAAEILGKPSRPWRLRMRIYLARLGDRDAALAVACEAALAAVEAPSDKWDERDLLVRSALGWVCVAASDPSFAVLGQGGRMYRHGDLLAFAEAHGIMLGNMIETASILEREARGEALDDAETRSSLPDPQPSAPEGLTAVVLRAVGNVETSEGKKVQKEFAKFVDVPLPLVATPDLAELSQALAREFPHATNLVDVILRDLAPRPAAYVRPTILVGAPGSGKTRFARRLLTLLGVPHDIVACGGHSDGSFAGTPRRWSTGEPSLPVSAITRHRHAGPGIVLDEVEKVGTGRHNGNVHDVLLAFFERETSRRFHDPYVQAECDLSHLTWMMTANGLTGIPAPLRDRCRVLSFPEPGREHLSLLANGILREIALDQGLDPRWAAPLDGEETSALSETWPGGSIRRLRRLVEAILEVRTLPKA